MINFKYDIYEKVIKHNGELVQKEKYLEEAKELSNEVMADIYENKYNRINMISEIADNFNTLYELMIIYDISDTTIENEMMRKMQRTLRDIEFNKTVE